MGCDEVGSWCGELGHGVVMMQCDVVRLSHGVVMMQCDAVWLGCGVVMMQCGWVMVW